MKIMYNQQFVWLKDSNKHSELTEPSAVTQRFILAKTFKRSKSVPIKKHALVTNIFTSNKEFH